MVLTGCKGGRLESSLKPRDIISAQNNAAKKKQQKSHKKVSARGGHSLGTRSAWWLWVTPLPPHTAGWDGTQPSRHVEKAPRKYLFQMINYIP